MGVRVRTLLILAGMGLAAGCALAQSATEQSTTEQSAETLRSSTSLVLVPTLVWTADGALVHSLGAKDFRVTDNGVEQVVTLEEIEHQPIAMVVLMQTGGAASEEFASYAKLGTMLDYVTGTAERRIAMVTFDSKPEEEWTFTPDLANLEDGFAHPRGGDDKVAIYDAVAYGIGLLKEQPPQFRRVLLLLSQKIDVGSKAKVEQVVRELGENNVTIYSVTFSPEKRWLKDQFTKPQSGNPPYEFAPGTPPLVGTFNLMPPLVMAVNAMRKNAAAEMASLAGGECVEFGGKHDLEQKLGEIANHIPNRYTLSFRPSGKDAGFHVIRVEVKGRPEWKVAARSGYWRESY